MNGQAASAARMDDGPLVILYDGDCRFCRAFAHAARRLAQPPGVRMLPFDDPRAVRILAALPPAARHCSVHAADRRGLASSTAAFRLICTRLRGGEILTRTGAYRVYPWVAAHRHWFGHMVPDLPRPPVG